MAKERTPIDNLINRLLVGATHNLAETDSVMDDAASVIWGLREALRDALEYADHDPGCSGQWDLKYRCKCRWRVEKPRLYEIAELPFTSLSDAPPASDCPEGPSAAKA